ncbi:MAG: tyrosine-protein phosphatase [Pseudomonadales bacterium]|nr:tyrosine-protein phosphatase [Pseudomonadales bacterium]
MINLKQSKLNSIDLSIIPIVGGWRIQWQCESVDMNKYPMFCEQLAGIFFANPIRLSIVVEEAANSVELSYAMLQAATGVTVDAYSHPIIVLVDTNEITDSDEALEQRIRLAPRLLPMTATSNFRDYGGQLTKEGRQVIWGKLFRTGHMGEMSEADKQALLQLNIKAICDFRRAEEMAGRPSQLPEGLAPTAISISPGSATNLFSAIDDEDASEAIDEEAIDAFMQEINRDLVVSHQSSYRHMFDVLIQYADSSSIIHCSAGKDRTGFGGLLVLSALGVEISEVMLDYLRTNEYVDIAKEVERWAASYHTDTQGLDKTQKNKTKKSFNRSALAMILKVKPSYLQAAIDTIDNEYGGIDSYLRTQIALSDNDFALLKKYYLYS